VPLTLPYMLKNVESKPVQMFAGVARRTLAQSNNLMVVEFRFLKGAEVGLHHHPNEQIGYVASGEVEMKIGDKNHRLVEGDSYLIPGEVIHGTKAIMDSVLVDIFYPPRRDYILV
jgi:quercetin dioxygenase-like cupin family protein